MRGGWCLGGSSWTGWVGVGRGRGVLVQREVKIPLWVLGRAAKLSSLRCHQPIINCFTFPFLLFPPFSPSDARLSIPLFHLVYFPLPPRHNGQAHQHDRNPDQAPQRGPGPSHSRTTKSTKVGLLTLPGPRRHARNHLRRRLPRKAPRGFVRHPSIPSRLRPHTS